MGWIGALGYQPTSLSEASHYVVARHYASARGSWTSVDPTWPFEAAYAYVEGRFVTMVDPTGFAPCPANGCDPKKDPCGWARKHGTIPKGEGCNICCKGTAVPCVGFPKPKSFPGLLVYDCILSHEKLHTGGVNCSAPGQKDGECGGPWPIPPDPVTDPYGECVAWQSSIHCFKLALPKCPPKDTICKDVIQCHICHACDAVQHFCGGLTPSQLSFCKSQLPKCSDVERRNGKGWCAKQLTRQW